MKKEDTEILFHYVPFDNVVGFGLKKKLLAGVQVED